jgi:hypothetical protein
VDIFQHQLSRATQCILLRHHVGCLLVHNLWEGRTHTISYRQYIGCLLAKLVKLKAHRSSSRTGRYGPDGGHQPLQQIPRHKTNWADLGSRSWGSEDAMSKLGHLSTNYEQVEVPSEWQNTSEAWPGLSSRESIGRNSQDKHNRYRNHWYKLMEMSPLLPPSRSVANAIQLDPSLSTFS